RFHCLYQIKFSLQARCSLQELLDDLNVCHDESYLPPTEVTNIKNDGWHVHKLLNGYLRWLPDPKTRQSLGLREEAAPYGDSDHDLEAWLASLPLLTRVTFV